MHTSVINGLMLKITKSTIPPPTSEIGKMLIVIHRPFASLQPELLRTFKGHRDVSIIQERRSEERRKQTRTVSSERRRKQRRKVKADILDVLFLA
jgi:hypothetical protein